LVATLPAQTRRFKLRISAILCKNSSDLFPDTKGLPLSMGHAVAKSFDLTDQSQR